MIPVRPPQAMDLNEAALQRRRGKMMLPAPQISDAELEALARQGGEMGADAEMIGALGCMQGCMLRRAALGWAWWWSVLCLVLCLAVCCPVPSVSWDAVSVCPGGPAHLPRCRPVLPHLQPQRAAAA